MVRSLSALLILAATATTASALPVQAEDTVSTRVSYSDLDIGHPAGIRALNARIHGAIIRMCGSADIRDEVAIRNVRTCRRTAQADASVKVAMLGLGDRRLADRGGVMLAGR